MRIVRSIKKGCVAAGGEAHLGDVAMLCGDLIVPGRQRGFAVEIELDATVQVRRAPIGEDLLPAALICLEPSRRRIRGGVHAARPPESPRTLPEHIDIVRLGDQS